MITILTHCFWYDCSNSVFVVVSLTIRVHCDCCISLPVPRYWCSSRCRNIVVSVVLQLLMLSGVLLLSSAQQLITRTNCSTELNICYEVNHQRKTLSEADDLCRKRNGTLATILDITTQQYIQSLLQGSEYYWTGGKLHIMHQWHWVDGSVYSGSYIRVLQQLLFELVFLFLFHSSLDWLL